MADGLAKLRQSLARAAHALLGPLLLGLATQAWSAEILVTAEDNPAIRKFAEALAERRPADRVRFETLDALPQPDQLAADTRLIILGPQALSWRTSRAGGPATLALLINREQAQRILGDQRPAVLTLLWSDPPIERQLRLIKQVLPSARRVGVLYNDHSAFLIPEARQAAIALDLTLVPQIWADPRDTDTLNQLLRASDVLLGLDDRQLYNPRTAKSLLLTSYAQNRPLFGPSAAFVNAGSLATSYSDQNDWLEVLDRLLDQPPARWPRALYPSQFKVAGNRQVARSLGIALPDDQTLTEQLVEGERP